MDYGEQKEYYYSLIDFIDRKIEKADEEIGNTTHIPEIPNTQAHISYWTGVREVMWELRDLVRPSK